MDFVHIKLSWNYLTAVPKIWGEMGTKGEVSTKQSISTEENPAW
jgi:hypothetical protein